MSWYAADGGYELWFNRDERKSRGPERPAREERLAGTAVLCPTDGDHGGTWLAVNEHGLCAGLTNAWSLEAGAPPGRRSRGLLVRDLADAASAAEVDARLAALPLETYAPFVLLCLEPGGEAALARWDGEVLRRDAAPAPPLVSSGVDGERVRRFRAGLLAELAARHGGLDAQVLERFHGSHAGGPSAYSPCMHRAAAGTRSQCRVRVTQDAIELVHVPGPPCATAALPPLRLARRARS